MAITPVFCCGWECGKFSTAHWGAVNNNDIVGSPVKSGSYALRVFPTAAASILDSQFTLSTAMIVARFSIRFATLPSSDCLLFSETQGSNGLGFQASDSTLRAARDPTTPVFGSTGFVVTTGVWYDVDIKIDANANPRTVDVIVAGTVLGQLANGPAPSTITVLRFGSSVAETLDVYYDDFVLSTTAADYPIGRRSIIGLVPDADGTHSTAAGQIKHGTAATPLGTDILPGTTDAFGWVNGRPIGGGASDNSRLINQAGTASASYVEEDFEATTQIVPPDAVEVHTVDQQATTSSGGFSTKLNDNGTEDVLITRSGAGVITDRFVTKQYATMVGGGAWTLARLLALKVRFGYSGDANPDQYWRGIMIEAAFPDALAWGGRPDGYPGQSQMQQLLVR